MPKSKIARGESAPPLDAVWYGERFPVDFIYDRPFGTGDGLIHLFHFRTDVVLRDVDGESTRESGHVILYPPDAPQHFQGVRSSGRPLLCDHVPFSRDVGKVLSAYSIPVNHAFVATRPQPLMDTVLSLRTEERKTQDHWQAAAEAYRTVLILQLAREAARRIAPSFSVRDVQSEQIIRDVCAMIDRNPAHPWMVGELAATVGLSRGRFSALFKQVTGVAPQDYAINARLHEVCVLLTNTSLSVAEIAERCGFRSPYYLSRLFSQRIGCPPSRYADRFQVAAE